jgi:hypothetical protein
MERKKYQHRVNITCGLWDAFKDFKQKNKLVYPKITRKEYVNICHLLNTKISDIIIKESFDFRMPGNLGMLTIRKSKVKIYVEDGKLQKNKMIIDWEKSWDYWHKEYPGKTRKEINAIPNKLSIYNMNEHTNGYIMGWHWDKTICSLPNQTVYYFKPTKRNRLALAAWIKSDEKENDYYLKLNYADKKRNRFLKREQNKTPKE